MAMREGLWRWGHGRAGGIGGVRQGTCSRHCQNWRAIPLYNVMTLSMSVSTDLVRCSQICLDRSLRTLSSSDDLPEFCCAKKIQVVTTSSRSTASKRYILATRSLIPGTVKYEKGREK